MRFDERIDAALRSLPVWVPPPRFAQDAASRAGSQVSPAAARPPALFWMRASLEGAAAGVMAYIGSSAVLWASALILTGGPALLQNYVDVLRNLFSRI